MPSVLLFLAMAVRRFLALFRPPASKRFGCRRTAPRSRPTHYRRKPQWVIREVIRLKAHTGLSCQKLADTFNRLYAVERNMTVGKTWVAQTIKRHHYEIAELRSRWKRQMPKPMLRNQVWGMDLTGKGDAAGNMHPILGVIDHGSRVALSMTPLPNKRAVTVLKALILAVETFGAPKMLKTDNEAIFHARLFRFALKLLDIRHQFSQPGMPWQNGRIERLFGTLKEKLDELVVADFNDLRQTMIEFRFWYNEIRPHRHLNGLTPMEAWRGIDPYRQAPKSAHLFQAWDGLLAGVYLRR